LPNCVSETGKLGVLIFVVVLGEQANIPSRKVGKDCASDNGDY
jgi:hypothetical protein